MVEFHNYEYDLIVIGAGSGGVRAARMASGYGAKVAIIEADRVGGTCVIRGCVPKKLFVYASRFTELFEVAGSFGWQIDARFDWETLRDNKDKEIDRLERAYTSTLENCDVKIIRDRATFHDAHTVRLVNADTTLSAQRVLIATGSHPFKPHIDGCELGFTSDEAFHLDNLPESIIVYGGGYIALEFATIFNGLGVETSVCYRGGQILRNFDQDMRLGIYEAMKARGIKFILNCNIESVEKSGEDFKVHFTDGAERVYGAVMFATGRAANIQGLELERAGVEITDKGGIAVDRYGQTTAPSVYAVGDVRGGVALTPVAIREGAAFVETVYNENPTIVDLSQIPTAVFTEPEIGVIGMSEHYAAKHHDIDVYIASFRPMMNVMTDKSERMILKLVTEFGGGRVLGCHILGPGAAEMIQLVAVPLAMGATKADFDRAIALHPSAAEELVTLTKPSYQYRDEKKLSAELTLSEEQGLNKMLIAGTTNQ
ncbi:glutathione-disulfide reductase [Aminobacter sp. MSH1]|uniref:glutathione-disulfide reductase n=1 Tax=Aminobacter sp. MSH1 TaxID=374606 RepID=UPI000D379665|nr:glutathione-disulfide reductase [Aminobacter sp. MSH1]